MVSVPRGLWGSRVGFILAAAGSAIGLGNVWRFPTTVGRSGGAAFVLLYLGCVLLIGLPIMLAELAIGRATRRNPVGAFAALSGGGLWRWVGALGVVTGIGILSYYSVVAGWTIGYFLYDVGGTFGSVPSEEYVKQAFTALISNPTMALALHGVFMAATMVVVLGGVKGGIERAAKVLMPVLLAILLLLVLRSVTLPGASVGLEFYLKPDFSKVSFATVMEAMGQAFFSLSLGMGAMITYGSYLSEKSDLHTSALWVVSADTAIALLAGLAIFPALFTFPGLSPAEGPGLIFVVLPNVFDKIPGGLIFGAGFFLLLLIAALTSSISLLEVPVAYLIDERGWTRRRAVVVLGTLAFVLGIPSALGHGAVGWLTSLPGIGVSFLDAMDTIFAKYSLTVGGLLLALFVGWRWGVEAALAEIAFARAPRVNGLMFRLLVRFLCPLAIAVILLQLTLSSLAG